MSSRQLAILRIYYLLFASIYFVESLKVFSLLKAHLPVLKYNKLINTNAL